MGDISKAFAESYKKRRGSYPPGYEVPETSKEQYTKKRYDLLIKFGQGKATDKEMEYLYSTGALSKPGQKKTTYSLGVPGTDQTIEGLTPVQTYDRALAEQTRKAGPSVGTALGDTLQAKDYQTLVNELAHYKYLAGTADRADSSLVLPAVGLPKKKEPDTYQKALTAELATFKSGLYWSPYERRGKWYVKNAKGIEQSITTEQLDEMNYENYLMRENRRLAKQRTTKVKNKEILTTITGRAENMRARGDTDEDIYIELTQWLQDNYGMRLEDFAPKPTKKTQTTKPVQKGKTTTPQYKKHPQVVFPPK